MKRRVLPLVLCALLPLAGCESEPEAEAKVETAPEAPRTEPELVAAVPIEDQPLYHSEMPAEGPDAAPETAPNLLGGGDFENVSTIVAPWYSRAHARRDAYRFTIDDTLFHGGKSSLRIEQVKPEAWAAAMQRIRYNVTMGTELELTAMLFGDGLMEAPGLLYLTKGGPQQPASGDVRIDANEANGKWVKARLRMTVPEGTQVVEIAVSHYGPGRLWIDDVAVRAVNPL